jgi:hypothetical protein
MRIIGWIIALAACTQDKPPPESKPVVVSRPAVAPAPKPDTALTVLGPVTADTSVTYGMESWSGGGTSARVDGSGHLSFTYRDGTTRDAGSVDPSVVTKLVGDLAAAGFMTQRRFTCHTNALDAGNTSITITQGPRSAWVRYPNACSGDANLDRLEAAGSELSNLFDLQHISRYKPGPYVKLADPVLSAPSRLQKYIYSAINSKRDAIRDCYLSALQKDPNLGGTLKFSFTLAMDGHAKSLTSSHWAEPTVPACIKDIVKALDFLSPERVLRVEASIELEPKAAFPVPPGVTPPPPQ